MQPNAQDDAKRVNMFKPDPAEAKLGSAQPDRDLADGPTAGPALGGSPVIQVAAQERPQVILPREILAVEVKPTEFLTPETRPRDVRPREPRPF